MCLFILNVDYCEVILHCKHDTSNTLCALILTVLRIDSALQTRYMEQMLENGPGQLLTTTQPIKHKYNNKEKGCWKHK